VDRLTNLANSFLLQELVRASLDPNLKERNFTPSYPLYLIFILVLSFYLSLGLPNGIFLQLHIKILCAFLNMCRMYSTSYFILFIYLNGFCIKFVN